MKGIILIIYFSLFLSPIFVKAQFLMDMVDTTKETGKGLLNVYKKFDHLKLGGYIQPQYQQAESNGINTYEGGDFAAQVNNRFMLRRSRIRIDYVHFSDSSKPSIQIVFQFDSNERGFTVRDVWGRVFENKYKLFSFTTGMFARPFGYETNLSSSDRESPERGRMNQILMKSERDLGVMLTFDARKKIGFLNNFKFDIGLFNGQGITATGDFDNSKDLIGRLAIKPQSITNKITFSIATSFLRGGLFQNTKYQYTTSVINNIKQVMVDSSVTNYGKDAPRHYIGADMQLKFANKIGYTECRAEYITGTQSSLAQSTETPVSLLTGTNGYYVRRFAGAYFYFLKHIGSLKNQMVIKCDIYDPNIKVKGTEINNTSGFTSADMKYTTWGIGWIRYISENFKVMLYYAMVNNEKTNLNGYTTNLKDNVLTLRWQYRF